MEAINGVAREAGRAVMEVYRRASEFELKADGSPITAADRLSHEIIAEGLRRLYPAIPVLSEEGRSIPYDERARWTRFFLVDPLDGTKEFIKGNGEFTVNIALIEGAKPIAGVIYAPALGSLYYAQAGSGAFKRSLSPDGGSAARAEAEKLQVSRVSRTGLTAVGSRSHASAEEAQFLSQFPIGESIAIGSSLKFCLVAEGRADLYYRHGHTWEWDTAAGHAIAEIAGARVSGLRYGKENMLNDPFLCASFDLREAGYSLPDGLDGEGA